MRRLRLFAMWGWFVALGSGAAFAQSAGQGSAVDLMQSGFFAYQDGDYAQAEAALESFLDGYGTNPEAKQFMDRVLRLLSLSLLQQKKFEEALPHLNRFVTEFPQSEELEEMQFWQALSLFQTEEYEEAFGNLEAFASAYPRHPEIEQVWMMMGMAQFALGNHAKTLEIFTQYRDKLSPVLLGQVIPIIVVCQMQLEQWDAAGEEILAFDSYDESMPSLGSVHLLTVQLGSQFMEQKETRKALQVLQKAWPQQRLISRQQGRLDSLNQELRRLQASPKFEKFEEIQLMDLIGEVEKDLERLKNLKQYDTALQFRIARCFLELDRYREGYLVLKEMVDRLPVSDLLLQANYQMLVSLTRMERWEEAIKSADVFAQRFPESALLDNVRYLQNEARMRLFNYEEAAKGFAGMVKAFPDFEQVERCHFLSGYCLMMIERNPQAVELFDQHLERWPRGDMREQVVYWKAMAFYYHKDYVQSREAHAAYLEEYPKGRYAVDSVYRRAHALFGQKKFIEAYKELEKFITNYGETLLADEARNLLGDCYFALGEIDRGLEAYRSTTAREGRLYDYARFRIGKALKSTEEFEAMLAHFQKFLEERPKSPRLTEALSQIAWIYRKNEEPEKAKDLYWDSIRQYGNDPEARGVEEMMTTLAKYYGTEKRGEYDGLLAELEQKASLGAEPTLASRAVWMRAQLQHRVSPQQASQMLTRAYEVAEPIEMSARVLADVADSLRENGQFKQAEECYRTILFWYPRSMLKDRSYAGLGLLAVQQNQPAEALRYFDLFERETVESPLWADVLEARANLYREQSRFEEAINELERILEIKAARGQPWVEALYAMGEIRMQQNQPRKAIPYFQRIYIMYGRWSDYVAKAYWESGQAFEALNMRNEAVNTYREFANNTHLKEKPEYGKALERLSQMGEPLTAPQSEGQTS